MDKESYNLYIRHNSEKSNAGENRYTPLEMYLRNRGGSFTSYVENVTALNIMRKIFKGKCLITCGADDSVCNDLQCSREHLVNVVCLSHRYGEKDEDGNGCFWCAEIVEDIDDARLQALRQKNSRCSPNMQSLIRVFDP